jgi:alkanesulfonate monooxygenase SsuD/methylene tetrahydromethanopterin reductase-like flavin-dependent oxidoreductase (luciferase family)
MGFDHVWLGPGIIGSLERPGADSLVAMAALALKTKKTRIGVIPFLPALWHPVLLAHQVATLDAISRGRIILGIGVAPLAEHIKRAFDTCDVPYNQKAGRLSECIEILRRLWTQETVTFRGKYYQFDQTGILPKPAQGHGVPLWIAAGNNDNALRRAARLGDGWFSSAALDVFIECRRKIDLFGERLRPENKSVPAALYAAFNLNSDGDAAKEEGWEFMERFFRQPRSKQQHLAFFGTPRECADILRKYKDAGVKMIVARLASDDLTRQMELFTGELDPLLSS